MSKAWNEGYGPLVIDDIAVRLIREAVAELRYQYLPTTDPRRGPKPVRVVYSVPRVQKPRRKRHVKPKVWKKVGPERHAEILRLAGEGLSMNAIGRAVGCDGRTVGRHLRGESA